MKKTNFLKNRITCALLIVCMLALMAGCGKKDVVDPDGFKLFYVNNSETGIVAVAYDITTPLQDMDAVIGELIGQLSTMPERLQYEAPLTGGVNLLGYSLNDKVLTLNFDIKYADIGRTVEILDRAAIVRTFTQLDGIEYVSFQVEGTPLSDHYGNIIGNMSADTLTVGCKRNVKPELAEAKGKRLIIAAELEEGMRLSTANVKQLSSTDEIYAEKKYKDPFSFVPSHTLVLYTNHLPKVGALDAGTWRRLIVIPFNAKIEGSSDIKNYADYLYAKAGGAILKWIMAGAKRVIERDYHVVKPAVVEEATRKYRENNDWLSQFFEECCVIDPDAKAKSGEFYTAYRSYCMQVGDYIRSTTDFYAALETAGFVRRKTNAGVMISGLQLKSDFLE